MTTWANGDTITAAWMNSLEQVLALGTFGATTSPRLTVSPNSTFDIASNLVATNLRFNGSVSVSGAGKQYEGISFRTLTSTNTGAAAYATCISYDHSTTLTSGAFAYGMIGSLTCNSGDADTKITAAYDRAVAGGTFAGTISVATIGLTYNTGASATGTSCLLDLELSGSNTNSFPLGLIFNSNSLAGILQNAIVFDSSIDISIGAIVWNQKSGGTPGSFLIMRNSSAANLFTIDASGNWNTGTAADKKIWNGTSNYITMPTNGDVVLGKAAAATGDTTGHMYIQAHAGAPTGVPAGSSGYVAMRYDTTAHKIYVYDGGWKATAALS